MHRTERIERIARWTYAHWTWIAGAAIALALILTIALLPGPSAGSASSASVGGPVYGPAVPLSSVPAWPAPTTTTTVPPAPPPLPSTPQVPVSVPTPTPTVVSASGDCGPPYDPTDGTGVTCAEYLAWSQVAVCEEGGWVGSSGSAYPDSLGISAANWWGNGGTDDVSPDAQILVALRIQTNPPDQGRCTGSW